MKSVLFLMIMVGLVSATDQALAQVYKGTVVDEITREPIPFVIVMLQNTEGEYVRHDNTDDNGHFEIQAPEITEYLVHVSRIGYTENTGGPFLVKEGDTLNIQFRVLEVTESLEEVTVEAERINKQFALKHLEENRFFVRQERGLGEFITRGDIEEMVAINRPSDLFRMIRGMSRNTNKGTCHPKIVLNGMTMYQPSELMIINGQSLPAFNLNDYIAVDRIIGVEVYNGLIGQPVEYGPRSRCGAVLVWTR